MTTQTADTLRRAKALIDDPERWTQHGAYARVRGANLLKETDPIPSNATCFCSIGAIAAAIGGTPSNAFEHPAFVALSRALCVSDPSSVISWNDSLWRQHSDVIRVFDEAIAAEEESP